MVTLALLAMVSVMAAPSIQDFVSRNALRSLGGDFLASMQYARAQAISKNQCVAICLSSTVGSGNQCAGVGNNWAQGWIVFRMPSCDQVGNQRPNMNPPPPTPADEILRVFEGSNARYQLISAGPNSIIFNARGLPNTLGTNFQLSDTTLADTNTNTNQRKYCMGMTGRLRTVAFTSSCS